MRLALVIALLGVSCVAHAQSPAAAPVPAATIARLRDAAYLDVPDECAPSQSMILETLEHIEHPDPAFQPPAELVEYVETSILQALEACNREAPPHPHRSTRLHPQLRELRWLLREVRAPGRRSPECAAWRENVEREATAVRAEVRRGANAARAPMFRLRDLVREPCGQPATIVEAGVDGGSELGPTSAFGGGVPSFSLGPTVHAGNSMGATGEIVPPRRLSGDHPGYPPEARARRIEGRVIARFTVTAQGTVEDVRLIHGDAVFYGVVRAALATWRFAPATRDGQPVAVSYSAPFRFQLSAD